MLRGERMHDAAGKIQFDFGLKGCSFRVLDRLAAKQLLAIDLSGFGPGVGSLTKRGDLFADEGHPQIGHRPPAGVGEKDAIFGRRAATGWSEISMCVGPTALAAMNRRRKTPTAAIPAAKQRVKKRTRCQSGLPVCTSFQNVRYLPVLAPYDLTRGGSYYKYTGRADVKEFALYAEDQIKAGNWLFNLGLREDVYNGLTDANQIEPRTGIAYNIKPSKTVLRVSYARTLETPFNENLVLSSTGCSNAVLSPLLNCSSGVSGTLHPGFKNE